jgi:hypothetical protein
MGMDGTITSFAEIKTQASTPTFGLITNVFLLSHARIVSSGCIPDIVFSICDFVFAINFALRIRSGEHEDGSFSACSQ